MGQEVVKNPRGGAAFELADFQKIYFSVLKEFVSSPILVGRVHQTMSAGRLICSGQGSQTMRSLWIWSP